jgi:hypothetical protein
MPGHTWLTSRYAHYPSVCPCVQMKEEDPTMLPLHMDDPLPRRPGPHLISIPVEDHAASTQLTRFQWPKPSPGPMRSTMRAIPLPGIGEGQVNVSSIGDRPRESFGSK